MVLCSSMLAVSTEALAKTDERLEDLARPRPRPGKARRAFLMPMAKYQRLRDQCVGQTRAEIASAMASVTSVLRRLGDDVAAEQAELRRLSDSFRTEVAEQTDAQSSRLRCDLDRIREKLQTGSQEVSELKQKLYELEQVEIPELLGNQQDLRQRVDSGQQSLEQKRDLLASLQTRREGRQTELAELRREIDQQKDAVRAHAENQKSSILSLEQSCTSTRKRIVFCERELSSRFAAPITDAVASSKRHLREQIDALSQQVSLLEEQTGLKHLLSLCNVFSPPECSACVSALLQRLLADSSVLLLPGGSLGEFSAAETARALELLSKWGFVLPEYRPDGSCLVCPRT